MTQPRQLSARCLFGSLVLIAVIIAGGAAAFAYTAGWFSPQRLTPDKIIDALTPPTGVPLGHRRNHAKGICFTGVFEASGAGSAVSYAQVFTRGQFLSSDALISAPPMRTRRMQPSGCGAWDCRSRNRTERSGAPP